MSLLQLMGIGLLTVHGQPAQLRVTSLAILREAGPVLTLPLNMEEQTVRERTLLNINGAMMVHAQVIRNNIGCRLIQR